MSAWRLWTVYTPISIFTHVQASSEYYAKLAIFRQTLGRVRMEDMTAAPEGCA